TGVSACKVLVKYSIEGAGPGLRDIASAESGEGALWLVSNQTAERPSGEIHIDVDHAYPFARRTGVRMRRRFSPRINLLAVSGMSASMTLPSCEAILRPKASLP